MSLAWLWSFLWIPLATAVVSMVAPPASRVHIGIAGTVALAIVGTVLLQAVAGAAPLSITASGIPRPFAISIVADKLAAIMLALTALLALASAAYLKFDPSGERVHPHVVPLFQFLLLGVNGVFLAADLFNLYVWFEVLLLASFGLLALRRSRPRIEGAVKYLTLNLIASTLLLTAAGTLYALTGTLNLAAMAQQLESLDRPAALNAAAAMLLVAFGLKSAVFPLYFWLPASYHTLPASSAAFFAGIMSKVGIYALIRLFTLVFPGFLQIHAAPILLIAGLTMVSGVLGAIAQHDIRRLLSFHIISQIGYLLMGLALVGSAGLAASIFFLVHVALAKSALFFVTGATQRVYRTNELGQMGGLTSHSPWLSVLFLVSALALAGFPPLSGFWGKLMIIRAGLYAGQYWITGVAIAVSLLTLYSMTKIWLTAFWGPPPEPAPAARPTFGDWLPLGALSLCVVVLGVAAEPGIQLATRTAEELLARQPYLRAALGVP